MVVYQLILGSIMGLVCAAIASSKGRSPAGWFLFGLFFNLLAVIVLFVVKDLNEEKAQREKDLAERRRLEEQLRQERLKNEVFRQYTSDRLDVHDRQLGVSTKDPSLTLGSGGAAPAGQLGAAPGATPSTAPPAEPSVRAVPQSPPSSARASMPRKWYFEVRGETLGPFSTEEIINRHHAGELAGSTLLWGEGSSQYVAVDQLLAK